MNDVRAPALVQGILGRVSLRLRTALAVALTAAYALTMYLYIEHERSSILADVAYMDELHRREDGLMRASRALSDSLYLSNRMSAAGAAKEGPVPRDLRLSIDELRIATQPSSGDIPGIDGQLEALQRQVAGFAAAPTRAGLYELRAALGALGAEIEREAVAVRERRRDLNATIRRHYNRVAVLALIWGLAGLGLFGLASHVFFSRLARDIRDLRERAQEIVQGYRGPPLDVRRGDEVGELAAAVNRLAVDLAERERRIDRAARRQIHRERMAALGSMATNVAHEVGNPLAVISGLAQEMLAGRSARSPCAVCKPEAIIEQAARGARLTRRVADFALHRDAVCEPVDLNAVVQAVYEFLRFDPRLRNVGMRLVLQRDLPAALAIFDHLTQLLTSLVLTAAGREEFPREGGRLQLSTGIEAGEPFVRVALTRAAAAGEAIAGAFEDAAVLDLCRQLAAEMGARIDIEPGDAPRATLRMPAAADVAALEAPSGRAAAASARLAD